MTKTILCTITAENTFSTGENGATQDSNGTQGYSHQGDSQVTLGGDWVGTVSCRVYKPGIGYTTIRKVVNTDDLKAFQWTDFSSNSLYSFGFASGDYTSGTLIVGIEAWQPS